MTAQDIIDEYYATLQLNSFVEIKHEELGEEYGEPAWLD